MKARDNPFAVDRVRAFRYRFAAGDWDGLFRRWAGLKHRAAVVGPQGAGKTTLLEDLHARLHEQGWRGHAFRLNEENRKLPETAWQDLFPRLEARDVILLDGAEQLGRLAWRRFQRAVRTAGGLIITTHRPGRLPTLLDCTTSPELLEDVIAGLLRDYAAAPADRSNRPYRETAQALFDKHRGNIRDALRDLYDQFARDENPFAGNLNG